MSGLTSLASFHARRPKALSGPVARLITQRLALGLLTLFIVSILVFGATQVLPGNAAIAVLGHSAPQSSINALEQRLHVDDSVLSQFFRWLHDAVRGDFGTSFVNQQTVSAFIAPKLANSAVLVLTATLVSTFLGLTLGAFAALRRDRLSDHVMSVAALSASALPEFVVAIVMILLFAVTVWPIFPAVSLVPPGEYIWQHPDELVLPVATLVIVVTPYLFRMMRAATIEALHSEYVEMARLKGVPATQVVIRHAVPNAMAPVVQVIGLNILYLAGGIVLVENVFNFPGIGNALVNAVQDRDIPVIQFVVLVLALVYVVVNIVSDVVVLLLSPRRRIPT
jgi:peptide/nickel transport system permease protein